MDAFESTQFNPSSSANGALALPWAFLWAVFGHDDDIFLTNIELFLRLVTKLPFSHGELLEITAPVKSGGARMTTSPLLLLSDG